VKAKFDIVILTGNLRVTCSTWKKNVCYSATFNMLCGTKEEGAPPKQLVKD